MDKKQWAIFRGNLNARIALTAKTGNSALDNKRLYKAQALVALWLDMTGDKGYILDLCKFNGISPAQFFLA